jgi:hypothetical protein
MVPETSVIFNQLTRLKPAKTLLMLVAVKALNNTDNRPISDHLVSIICIGTYVVFSDFHARTSDVGTAKILQQTTVNFDFV